MSDEIDNTSAPKRQRPKGRRSPRDGEIGIRYGRRNFLITPGQALVAQDGPWHLVAVEEWDRPGWHNFKLYLNRKAQKNMFNISVNKHLICGKRDIVILEEHYPGRKAWVVEMANKFIDGQLVKRPEKGTPIIYSAARGWRKITKSKGGK